MAQEDRSLFWSRENEVSEEWIQFVDDNVLAGKVERERSIVWPLTYLRYSELPQGTQIIGASSHGASCWTPAAEIETQQADGSELSFSSKSESCLCHFRF